MSRSARFHGGRTKRCMAIAPSTTLLLRRVLYGISCRNDAGGRRGDSRGDRAVGVDRVPGVHRGQRGQAPRAPRAGPVPGRTSSPWCWTARPSPRSTMVVALGITMTGETRFLGFVETATENEQVLTPFPPVPGRAGPRCLPGAAGDRGGRQGAPGGRAEGLPPPRPGASGVNGTRARTW